VATGSDDQQLDARERVVAEAALRIAARDGLDAVSIRTVAAEAGYSLGMVQRLFATKDELMRRAMAMVAERLGSRVARLNPQRSPRTALRRLGVILLAMDDTERADALVWMTFSARAAFRPDLAAQLREHYSPAQYSVRLLLDIAKQRGELVNGVRTDLAATALLALIDGLTVHLLIGLIDLATAKRVLYRNIDAYFTNAGAA